ncbi:DUF2809 domain-containing protein [Streptomyces virginiae]|uniref:DUF2809 domain-containing protein n=1 Tax=Streptomyces virginiae TaxID=1961 RepID=UPI003420CE80
MAAAAAVVTVGRGARAAGRGGGRRGHVRRGRARAVLPPALVVLVAPRWTHLRAAGTAPAVSWAVELFRLSSVPAELSWDSVAARLVLGSTFNAPDPFRSAVGAAAGGLPHIAMSRRRRTPVVGDTPHTCRGTMRRRARIGGVRAAGPADRPTGHPGHMT